MLRPLVSEEVAGHPVKKSKRARTHRRLAGWGPVPAHLHVDFNVPVLKTIDCLGICGAPGTNEATNCVHCGNKSLRILHSGEDYVFGLSRQVVPLASVLDPACLTQVKRGSSA